MNLCTEDLPVGASWIQWLGSSEPLTEESREVFVQALEALSDTIQPALAHAGPIPTVASVVAEALTVPIVAMSWGSDLLVDTRLSQVLEARARMVFERAQWVIVDCDTVRRRALELGARKGRFTQLPWGVDLEQFRYCEWPELSAPPIRLLNLRSLEEMYGIETILHGVSLARERLGSDSVRLHLAGSGSQERGLKRLAIQLGISDIVEWLGRIPEGEVPSALRLNDVHISASRSDGSSISLLQAMAVGRPSIVSDIPGNREWIVEGETGWFFAVDDPESLSDALARALEGSSSLLEMGRRARSEVEHRGDWVVNSRLITDMYDRVAGTG